MHSPALSYSGDTPAVSRRDKFLIASVAMVSAGAIAVTPVAQNTVDIRQAQTFAYDLTASMNATGSPLDVYGSLVNTTFSNLQLLGGAVAANPAPLLSQILENQLGYAGQFGAAFEAIPASLQAWYDGPNGQERLAQAQAALQAGDIGEAYRWFNHSMLYAFQGAFGPLIAPGFILSGIPRGGTEYLAGIPEQIAQNFTNLIAASFTSSVLVSALFQGTFAMVSGSMFELSRIGEAISTSATSGDVQGVVNALVNTPGIIANAVLNGFDYSDVDPETGTGGFSEWPALLTFAEPGEQGGVKVVAGLLQNLLVNIPKSLADAIDNTPEVAPEVALDGVAEVAPEVAPDAVPTVGPEVAPRVSSAQRLSAVLNVSAVESPKVATPAVESLREAAPAVDAAPGVTDEVAAEPATPPAAGTSVNADDAAKGKGKITDRIKAKVNEAKEARQAKAKEAKESKVKAKVNVKAKVKANDAKGSNDSKGGSGSGSS